ncbi:MAG: 2-hydroxyacid dehydrogenase [Moraxellaceae bacterium]|nr:MAG: 2-hydroxyacid dehydrogenase [Moraxellaceae bacterium]
MKVAIFSSKPYDEEYLRRANDGRYELEFHPVVLNERTVVLAQGCAVVCCFVNDCLNAQVLDLLTKMNITFIALRCAGFNNVDLIAAKKLGIKVARVPEYSPHAVAEHALGLILMLNRNLHRAYHRVRENDYSLNGLLGFDLVNKTVAVIGTGKIGQVFSQIMIGIGCNVIAYDPVPNQELVAKGVRYLPAPEIWPQADIISLHCPLHSSTQHLINAKTIAQLKAGVMLINTGRGGLIDTPAVVNGLKTKKIGYLGLDVYEEESELFFEDNSNELLQDDTFARLLTFPNVVVTGHQAFFTHEALTAISEITLSNIDNFAQGELNKLFLI